MKPHKWAKEIKAWADGAEIESRHFDGDENLWSEWKFWSNNKGVTVNFLINEGIEYRIKPQPKEPQYLYVYRCTGDGELRLHEDKDLEGSRWKLKGKIKLEDES